MWNDMTDTQRLVSWREACDQLAEARAEVERLRALIKRARPYVQAYAAITRTDEVSLDASETAEAMRLSGPTTAERKEHGAGLTEKRRAPSAPEERK